jgi:phosphoglycolate phosphatase-like HAD superfamily hydrolase
MKFYKCLIYDFDGVICDSVNLKTEAFESLYSSYGEEVVKKVRDHHLLNGGISRFEKFKYFSENILNQEISKIELEILGKQFSDIVLNKIIHAPINPGVIEFIESNIPHSLQFICSGTPHEEMNHIIIEKKIGKYFNGVFGSPDSKTKIINHILSKYELKPAQVLFFGDAMTDYNAAKETSIDFIGIENIDTNFPAEANSIKSFKELMNYE